MDAEIFQPEDEPILQAIVAVIVEGPVAGYPDLGGHPPLFLAEMPEQGPMPHGARYRSQVAAVQLQMRLDKKAGRPSSPATRAIAEARPLKNGEIERHTPFPPPFQRTARFR